MVSFLSSANAIRLVSQTVAVYKDGYSLMYKPKTKQVLIFKVSAATIRTFRIAQRHYSIVGREKISESGSLADKESNIDKQSLNVQPSSVPVHAAYKLLQAGHSYLDVRTHEEFNAGHVPGSVNIPYMFRGAAEGMLKNSKFLEEVSSQFRKDQEIIVGCKSGRRSLIAATDLQSAGFTCVTDVAGGYSAWTENGLPTAK